MNSFSQLHSLENRLQILEFLKTKRNQQWDSQNLDKFWHTSRMLQSITHFVIKKKLFIHNDFKNKVIMANFSQKKKTIVEYYEVWVDENLSFNEIQLLCQSLLEIFKINTSCGKNSYLLCMPKVIKDEIIKEYSKYETNVAFLKKSDNYFFNYHNNQSNNLSNENYLPSKVGFEIQRIPIENTENVVKNWKFGSIADKNWVEYSISHFPSLGIWDVSNSKMVGQFIYLQTGLFGSLHIDDEYRGKGLATMLIHGMVEEVKSRNMDMMVVIDDDNIVSKNIFQKLNFQKISESTYIALAKDNILYSGSDF